MLSLLGRNSEVIFTHAYSISAHTVPDSLVASVYPTLFVTVFFGFLTNIIAARDPFVKPWRQKRYTGCQTGTPCVVKTL